MIVFNLQLSDPPKVEIFECISNAQLLLKAYVSRYWFEKLRLVVLRGAYVHVRIDADCKERVISLDGTAEFKLWRVRTMRNRTLRCSVVLSWT